MTRRRTAPSALTAVLCLGLLLAGCSGSAVATPSAAASDCLAYEPYGDLRGTMVNIAAGLVAPRDKRFLESVAGFERCTGATIRLRGRSDIAAVLEGPRDGLADLAVVDPAALQRLITSGRARAAAPSVVANLRRFWRPEWQRFVSVDGTVYGAPFGVTVKSLVWYSPKAFAARGYAVPTTLGELMALTARIAATGTKPWCAGIESGLATGWPATDWMEDMLLRLAGPQQYDRWVRHEIAFDSPDPAAALDAVGEILKDDRYVNGGIGDVRSVARTNFSDGGLPILDGTCLMHHQASFYTDYLPARTSVAPDGAVFAFSMPPVNSGSRPVLGTADVTVALADRPEVRAFQTYLASDLWANDMAAANRGDFTSANTGLDSTRLAPLNKMMVDLLRDPLSVFRYDGSDLMPAPVSQVFWEQVTRWVDGQSTAATLRAVERAWPARIPPVQP